MAACGLSSALPEESAPLAVATKSEKKQEEASPASETTAAKPSQKKAKAKPAKAKQQPKGSRRMAARRAKQQAQAPKIAKKLTTREEIKEILKSEGKPKMEIDHLLNKHKANPKALLDKIRPSTERPRKWSS